MSSTRDKIIGLLGAGVSQTLAAEAAGVSDGYVSQLLLDDNVRAEIAAKKSAKLEQHVEVDSKIEDLERLALKVMEKKLNSGVVSLSDATRTFSVLNAAKKKSEDSAMGNNAANVDTVIIVLPKAAKTMIQISGDNQIVEIDGKTTAPLPSKVLPSLQQKLAANPSPQLPSHVTDVQAKVAAKDAEKAAQILADVVTVIDGVQVVI